MSEILKAIDAGLTIKRHCYFPHNRPRVWWWKIVDEAGKIIADGFSGKNEAAKWQTAQNQQRGAA